MIIITTIILIITIINRILIINNNNNNNEAMAGDLGNSSNQTSSVGYVTFLVSSLHNARTRSRSGGRVGGRVYGCVHASCGHFPSTTDVHVWSAPPLLLLLLASKLKSSSPSRLSSWLMISSTSQSRSSELFSAMVTRSRSSGSA